MTLEEFERQIKSNARWMQDYVTTHPELSGDKCRDHDAILDDIDENIYSEVYEVHVDYHLTNGEIIKTRSHCIESYCSNRYLGDRVFITNGWLYVEFNTNDGIFHQSRVKPESVCWIDAYSVDIDWKGNTQLILRELKLD